MLESQPESGGTESTGRNARRSQIGVRSGKRMLAAVLAASQLIAAACSLTGCGQGAISFDGGHIPIGGGGGSTSVAGLAFVSEDFNTPIPGATVTVTNTSITGAKRTLSTITAKDGSFTFAPIPDAAAVNQYVVSVAPPAGSNYSPEQIQFPVQAGANAQVMLSLPLNTFNKTSPASIQISASQTLHTGDTIKINAELLDVTGNILPVSPTLVFVGNFGVLTPDGLFTGTSAGTGNITAYWNTGFSQLSSSTSTLIADTATTYAPPPPPAVPPIAGPPK